MPPNHTATTLRYLGWSGFEIVFGDGLRLFIDPPQAEVLPDDGSAIVFLTHGHPEHVGGLRSWLNGHRGEQTISIVASPRLCRYFEGSGHGSQSQCHPVSGGAQTLLPGNLRVDVFKWHHLSLLPPGLGAKIHHIRRLMSRPRLAARILRAAASGPRAAPMLGFTLSRPGAPQIVIYGEGLHRRTPPAEVAMIGKRASGSVLLIAVEPEDVDALPALIAASRSAAAILYEPHAIWRDAFGMRRADLARLQGTLTDLGVTAEVMTPGSSWRLST